MGVFVRLFACLPIRVFLCFFGWLVGWLVGWLLVSMCAGVFFGTLRHIFASYSHFGKHFCVFLAFWRALGLICNTWGSTLPAFVDILHDFRTWWDLGAEFADFWAPFGCP